MDSYSRLVAYVAVLCIHHTHLVNPPQHFLQHMLTRYVYSCLFSLFIPPLSVYQDFDQDDYLGKEDLKQTLRAITANELTDEEMEFVSDKV